MKSVQTTNEETSAKEVAEFIQNPPTKYFAYIKAADARRGSLTTWMGDVLGSVELGREFRDNFGGTRVSIRVHGINGREYFGTYFKSAGDYARITCAKVSQ